MPMSKVQLDFNRVVPLLPVCPLCTILQAVSLLLHEHLFVCALDPRLTITQVGLKAPDPLLDLPSLSHQAGRYHLKFQVRHQPQYWHSLAGLLQFLKLFQFVSIFFFCLFFFFTLSSSFILRVLFINLKRCSFTKLPESTDQFPLREIIL